MSETSKPSAAWYLAPIFLGLIGGIIMYVVLKDENRNMAKKGIILSIVLTIIYTIGIIPIMMLGILAF